MTNATVSGHGLLKDRLAQIEAIFHAAWTGPRSTPFLPDLALPDRILEEATDIARSFPLFVLFQNSPTLAVWSVLRPLALNYGADTKDVYAHIDEFLGKSFPPGFARDDLKRRFRSAARSIGLPVSGTTPTDLFFAPLGPARHQVGDLAHAFVAMTLVNGPPAIEDTAAARSWQRRAVAARCPGMTRLLATIRFDASAWCARRFEAWRQGQEPVGDGEAHLFDAYGKAASTYGRKRTDLIGPPRLFWQTDRLALEAEVSKKPQTLKLGAFPTNIPSGGRVALRAPWPREVAWRAGIVDQDIQVAPGPDEVLVFDADTGSLLARVGAETTEIEVAAARLVVLGRQSFASPSFGASIPAQDPAFQVAWVEAGEDLNFSNRGALGLVAPREDAIWIDATVLGRDGNRALHAADGRLHLKIDPEVGGRSRILRLRINGTSRFHPIETSADGTAEILFAEMHLSAPGDPGEAIFDVLVPGAAGEVDARATLSTRCWIWPGLPTPAGDLADVPVPANLDLARSAGLRVLDGTLSVDAEAEEEVPILGLRGVQRTHEFHLAARGEKLWHCRVGDGSRSFVPKGTTLVLGQDNRHDTLRLRAPDRTADLLVLGRLTRRPFHQRQVLEIGAGQLQDPVDGDDRIALRRADGRIELLARLHRRADPTGLTLSDGDGELRLSLRLETPCDALRITVETVTGESFLGDWSFGRHPVDMPPLRGVSASYDRDSRTLSVSLSRSVLPAPARVLFEIRDPEGRVENLRDIRGARIALGLPGFLPQPDINQLANLARFLAEPEPESLDGQVSGALTPVYEAAIDSVAGGARLVGSVKPLLTLTCADGSPPRHDLVAAAPWIFEAGSHAFSGLAPDTGLAALASMAGSVAPDPRPLISGDHPLEDWLTRVSSATGVPRDFQADALTQGFRVLRWRLRETDLHDLVRDGQRGAAVRLICSAHAEGLEQLRSFDTGGGGDPLPVRIAIQLERHARACAMREASAFVEAIAFRTGLPRSEIGRTQTMMLRAGVEIFAYFRALWAHAAKGGQGQS
ncbi:hypothetical protein P6F26_13565 [Roseibacterium sp. SDUM158017]|uniref:hypothetical protein n=1 Tax=Roseicyclus salinarum TaxID=3036773 RepID=UPI0024157A6D|nr:hypothetical protein [Roseibacterium sp. SDUM158017]MDG4649467.1 hypothetical protein [Roseibacterium sp. SDUM158017]